MHKHSLLLVHGFGVASCVFRPLLRRLNDVSTSAELFRYPSVGLELAEIVARLSRHLRDTPPDSIIAHSLGCIASWFAVRDADWRGTIVLLAPPLKTLPLTRLIPSFARMPFAPLLDHRDLFTDPEFRLPTLPGCTIQTIAGRNDLLVHYRAHAKPMSPPRGLQCIHTIRCSSRLRLPDAASLGLSATKNAGNHPMHPSRRVGRFDYGKSFAATG
ncbi:alpha/beta fold hydrolase [Rubripirellula tenax]|uniref:alpha/beta fold hydrolase n=1 Tax=Rubripirellula tenax TaxID=2528015 RepID=UPI0016474D88